MPAAGRGGRAVRGAGPHPGQQRGHQLGRAAGRVSRLGLGQGPGPEPQDAVLPDPGVPAVAGGGRDGLRVPEYGTYSYAASKAGLHQLTRVLARELGPRQITVNAVAPGPFESKMMAVTLAQQGEQIAAASPLGRIGRPDDMAGVAVFLSGRGSAYVTGAVIPVDGGIWAAR